VPNWCFNELTISGSKKSLDKCLRSIKGKQGQKKGAVQPLDFEKIVPTPKALINTVSPSDHNDKKVQARLKKYGYENWYDFHCSEWGTKWNCGEASLSRISSDKALITFDTAWSPPKPVIEKLSMDFPDLEFHLSYQEEGSMPYTQSIIYKQGAGEEKE